jgi:ketosteroid isomerase-like protein
MHLFSSTLAGIALAGLACNAANADPELKPSRDPSFNTFLLRFEEGISRFLNGDRQAWKDNASQRDDVTVMGAWGAYEKGWQQASPRYDWAAARFKDSGAKVSVEYVSAGVSGDLAYTIAIERSIVRLAGMDEPEPMALRVTHLFRKEGGNWKMIHRHADPLMDKTSPKATLQDRG